MNSVYPALAPVQELSVIKTGHCCSLGLVFVPPVDFCSQSVVGEASWILPTALLFAQAIHSTVIIMSPLFMLFVFAREFGIHKVIILNILCGN